MYRHWRPLALALLLVVPMAGCNDGSAPQATPSPTLTAAPAPSIQPTNAPPPSPASKDQQAGVLVIRNGTLIDGTGAGPLPHAYVVVRGERILSVGSGEPQIPAGATVVDARGGTILPGLIDAHVHVTRQLAGSGQPQIDPDGLLPWLRSGVTVLRDVGAPPALFASLRSFAEGLTKGHQAPRVVWAGPRLTAVGGYPTTVSRYDGGAQEVSSAQEAQQLVHRLADEGAGIIKVALERGLYQDEGWPLLSLDEVRAITEAAHQRGLLVTAHVTSLDEVRLALDGGVDSLAHAPLDPLSDEMIREMLEKQMAVVSTATIWSPDAALQAAANAKRYADAGGTVALGTDFGCCGQRSPGLEPLRREMEALLQAGLTPLQLVVAATRNGAIVSNLAQELGTIEPGKIADIIVVDGDPLADIGALRDVSVVIQAGEVVQG